MENENQTKVQAEVAEQQSSPLHSVTPLSKYLAMLLFIILPFVGGYVGYTYAPEKIVEVEKVVIKEMPAGSLDLAVPAKNQATSTLSKFELVNQSLINPECVEVGSDIVKEIGGCFNFEFTGTTTVEGILITDNMLSPFLAISEAEGQKFPQEVKGIAIPRKLYRQIFSPTAELEKIATNYAYLADNDSYTDAQYILVTAEISGLILSDSGKGSAAYTPKIKVLSTEIVSSQDYRDILKNYVNSDDPINLE